MLPDARAFDPEEAGVMLDRACADLSAVMDFQVWGLWQPLAVQTAFGVVRPDGRHEAVGSAGASAVRGCRVRRNGPHLDHVTTAVSAATNHWCGPLAAADVRFQVAAITIPVPAAPYSVNSAPCR